MTNALGDPAVDLPLGQHRVDQIAEVIDYRIAVEGHHPGFRVDHHLGHMGPVGIAAPRQAGAFVVRQQIIPALGAGHFGHLQHGGRGV